MQIFCSGFKRPAPVHRFYPVSEKFCPKKRCSGASLSKRVGNGSILHYTRVPERLAPSSIRIINEPEQQKNSLENSFTVGSVCTPQGSRRDWSVNVNNKNNVNNLKLKNIPINIKKRPIQYNKMSLYTLNVYSSVTLIM